MSLHLVIQPEVADALATGDAVVALESTAIAHGLPWPDNLDVARRLEAAVRAEGAVPALVGVLDGRLCVGVDDAGLERFARGRAMAKVSRRDLPLVVARGGDGATTVSATMIAATMVGIPVFATGGLGGVHRDAAESFDVSADLAELGRTGVAVVCSGAKSILDLGKTVEILETLGVTVLGYRTDRFPAFQVRRSQLPVDARVETAGEAASVIAARRNLGLAGAVVVGNPVPDGEALNEADVEGWVARAVEDAAREGVRGKAITPFLLHRMAELSQGRTLTANVALLESNARLGGAIAVALSDPRLMPRSRPA